MMQTVVSRTLRPDLVVVVYGGREFVASRAMADAFFARARRVVEAGASELVPLLHRDGVELLLVSREIPFSLATPNAALKRSA